MPDVVVISTDNDEVEESPTEEVAEEVSEALSDAVMDAATISLVERVTRVEDSLVVMAATVEAHSEQLGVLTMADEIQQAEIEQVAEATADVAQTEEAIAEGAADAIEEVAEDVEEASPEIEPDEIPSVRTHWFFKRWGNRD